MIYAVSVSAVENWFLGLGLRFALRNIMQSYHHPAPTLSPHQRIAHPLRYYDSALVEAASRSLRCNFRSTPERQTATAPTLGEVSVKQSGPLWRKTVFFRVRVCRGWFCNCDESPMGKCLRSDNSWPKQVSIHSSHRKGWVSSKWSKKGWKRVQLHLCILREVVENRWKS